jgi:hypothetical protein
MNSSILVKLLLISLGFVCVNGLTYSYNPWMFAPTPNPPIPASVGDTIFFNITGTHNVYQFVDRASYKACDFTGATFLCNRTYPMAFGCSVTVNSLPSYYGCSLGVSPNSHCNGTTRNMKTEVVPVVYSYNPWMFAPTPNPPIVANVGDAIFFNITATHNVYQFVDQASYQACDFTGATFLCNKTYPVAFGCYATVNSLPSYYGCSLGVSPNSHCNGTTRNMKTEVVRMSSITSSTGGNLPGSATNIGFNLNIIIALFISFFGLVFLI